MSPWRAVFAVALLVGVSGTLSAAGTGAASSATRVVTAAPRLPFAARDLGAVRADATVAGAVVLKPRSQAALTRFIAAVTDKHSPLFHHYLAPGQFASRFGPSPSSIAAVTSALRAEGLAVTVARNGMFVHFRGAAAAVEHTFRVGLDRVRLADGTLGRVRTSAVRLPGSIAGLVTSVVGLDRVVRLRPHAIIGQHRSGSHVAAKTASFPHPAGSPTPCAKARAVATQFGGLTDDQIAHAYGAFGLYGEGDFGAGQHIAVFELEPFAESDIDTFNTCYFGAAAAADMATRRRVIEIDGGQPPGAGSGEALLDIEDISAIAPGANIDVYEAPNTTFGALDAYAAIVNDDVDQIVSTSWGLCEQVVQQAEPGVLEAENLLFQQAAAQGQSIFAASGDNGSDGCYAFYESNPTGPVLTQDDPASQPYVVGVGGTTIDNPTQPAEEHVWNNGIFWGAGGGGISDVWPMPSWQLSSLVPGIHDPATIQAANTFEAGDIPQPGFAFCLTDSPAGASQTACREVPDVSAQADEFTGGITVYADVFGGWNTFGGTSSAAPIWAALLALTNASATCQSNVATANGVGFVSPLLYSVASDPSAYAASFNDITAGNNDPYGYSGLFPATTGYDMATGLGSPQLTQPGNAAGLSYYLCAAAASGARPTVTNLAAKIAATSAASTTVTITGTNFESNATPAVAGIQVGDYALSLSEFTVNSATSITATFPAASKVIPADAPTNGAGRVQVIVTLTDGESSAPGPGSAFTYVDRTAGHTIPAVIAVGPYGGSLAGGNSVIIYGSGFTGATGVKFGNRTATFTVLHDWQIQATVPAYVGGTTACVEDGSFFDSGNNATNDLCQAQVVVSNTHGSSKKLKILPLFEGSMFSLQGSKPPAGQEFVPAPTEYDYFPAPTITSISTDDGPRFLASEYGDSVITLKGTGFNAAALQWVTFGDPDDVASQASGLISITGTEIQVLAPQLEQPTTGTLAAPVAVKTIAGQSGSIDATYAGIPEVTGVMATAGPTAGKPAGPATGGTPIQVTGHGFTGQVVGIAFVDARGPFSVGTQYRVTVNSDTDLSSTTVPQSPAIVDVLVCTVTSCSQPSARETQEDVFFLYPPGDPKVVSITPTHVPADGRRKVLITGENLGCVTGVYFGGVPATKVSNAVALLDCGSTTQVSVTTPSGKAGKSVRVRVTTAESDFTGFGMSTDMVFFTYTHALLALLTVKSFGNGDGTVSSAPAGVHCGSGCHHRFPYGKSVTLTAVAEDGSRFVGWRGGMCTGTGPCTVRMKGPRVISARFVLRP